MLFIKQPGVRHCIEGVVPMVIDCYSMEDYGEDMCWLNFVKNGHLVYLRPLVDNTSHRKLNYNKTNYS